ncbi:hypothetical protein GCM10022245_21530 [Streptomyces mayteni]
MCQPASDSAASISGQTAACRSRYSSVRSALTLSRKHTRRDMVARLSAVTPGRGARGATADGGAEGFTQ